LEWVEQFRPRIGLWLNLTEDHLDRHGGYAGYVAAKLRIFENQTGDDVALLNADDAGTLAAGEVPGAGRRAWFSTGDAVEGQVAGVTDGRAWVAAGGRRHDLCVTARSRSGRAQPAELARPPPRAASVSRPRSPARCGPSSR
jgi:UDP-N-acetylmuramoylalanine-D-glutamate ligase